ncbi:antibiotic biosynthesis monooxygenase [Streptosporangium subroseum]|uniref:putative quinol monooxygenase n=1 Tax=Streptosporangium subroseum TaxID=106412 RepID=UPI0034421C2D
MSSHRTSRPWPGNSSSAGAPKPHDGTRAATNKDHTGHFEILNRPHGVARRAEERSRRSEQLGADRGVVVLERYASREAFAAHRAAPHFQHLVIDQIIPLLDDRVVDPHPGQRHRVGGRAVA